MPQEPQSAGTRGDHKAARLVFSGLPSEDQYRLEVLDGGGTLGIFPQGRLPVDGKPFPFTVSTAFIATNTDAPIIPVYTGGKYGISRRADVVIGAPIHVADHLQPGLSRDAQLQKLTELLEKTVYDLKSYL